MIATIPYIQKKFSEYNELIFGGALEMPTIKLSSARRSLGKLRYLKKRSLFGGVKYSNFCLLISKNFDLDEDMLDDTIIHEMMHYYIAVKGIKDTSAHGKVFRQMMKDINLRFNRHITISYKPAQVAPISFLKK